MLSTTSENFYRVRVISVAQWRNLPPPPSTPPSPSSFLFILLVPSARSSRPQIVSVIGISGPLDLHSSTYVLIMLVTVKMTLAEVSTRALKAFYFFSLSLSFFFFFFFFNYLSFHCILNGKRATPLYYFSPRKAQTINHRRSEQTNINDI